MATSQKATRKNLAPPAREIAAARDFLLYRLLYRDNAKVQPLAAQVGWSHNRINAGAWTDIPIGGAP